MLRYRIQGLLLLGFVLFFYIFSDSYFALLLLSLTLTLLIYLGLTVLFQKNKLELSLRTSGSIHKNKTGFIVIEARNLSFFPVAKVKAFIMLHNQLTGEKSEEVIEFPLGIRARDEIIVEVNSPHCGNMEIYMEKMIIYDFLGIFSKTVNVEEKNSLFILPDSFPISIFTKELAAQEHPDSSYLAMKKGKTGQDVFDVKEYAPGDNIRHVHWKLTSKFDTLMTKEFTESTDQNYLILLESSLFQSKSDSPEQTDAMMETFISVSKALLDNNNAHTISWFDHETQELQMEEVYSEDHLVTKLRTLLKFQKHESKKSSIGEYAVQKENLSFSHVVYVTTEQSAGFIHQTVLPDGVTVLNCSEADRAGVGEVVFNPENRRDELSELTI